MPGYGQLLVMAGLLSGAGWAESETLELEVRLHSQLLPPGVERQMIDTVNRIFAAASLRVRWQSLNKARPPAPMGPCIDRGLGRIDAVIGGRAESANGSGPLGEAWPFASAGTRVKIHWPRIAARTGQRWHLAGLLAGHALAHEIGHVLIGRLAHSESGLMSAYWGHADLGSLAAGQFSLTPAEIGEIRSNLEAQRVSSPCQG